MSGFLPFPVTKGFLDIAKQHRFLTGLAIFYILSVIWGTYRFYSPIPQLDMWHGYIDFYLRLLDGDNSAWWGQHNEHRLILSRVLFYLDLAFLGGQSKLLLPVNVIFVFVSWFMLTRYASVFLYQKTTKELFYFLLVLITVFAFSWKQDENIIWAFQSQFWFAYLLPLLAFYFLAMSETNKDRERLYFGLACLLGILSAGSMANGMLALALLVVMSLVMKKNTYYITTLFVLAVVVAGSYLFNFDTPEGHTSFVENVINHPFQIIIFFIEFVGVPPKNIYASFAFGLLHLYLIFIAFVNIKQHLDKPLYLSIIAFISYYLASAVAISGGRADHGINAALAGRYTTPAFISFSLALILYLYNRPQGFRYLNKRTITIIAVLMLGTQARTVIKNVDKIHDVRDRETMQMEIGIFAYKPFQQVADKAHQKNISVFGLEPFRDKKEKLGRAIDESGCQQIEYSISKSNRHSNLIIKEQIPINEAVYIASDEKRIIGFGLMSRQFKNTVQEVLSPAHLKGNGKLLYRCWR